MDDARKAELQQKTRKQLAYLIEDEIECHGELLLKEVYEECNSRLEDQVVREEALRLATLIRNPPPKDKGGCGRPGCSDARECLMCDPR